MSSAGTKFTVGLFVAGGITIILVAIIWLGVTRVFEEGYYYVTYFNESVQGLSKDSQVKYRGVPVGRVDEISVAPDSKMIQAVLKMETDREFGDDIVAQLKPVGITGSMFIELDRKKPGDTERAPAIDFPTKYRVIQSKPSQGSELFSGMDRVIEKIEQNLDAADIKGISQEIKDTLVSLQEVITDPKISSLVASLERNSHSIEEVLEVARQDLETGGEILNSVNEIVSDNQGKVGSALDNINTSTQKADQAFTSLNASLSLLEKKIKIIAENLEQTTRTLNRIARDIEDTPSRLLFSEPPAPRTVHPQP